MATLIAKLTLTSLVVSSVIVVGSVAHALQQPTGGRKTAQQDTCSCYVPGQKAAPHDKFQYFRLPEAMRNGKTLPSPKKVLNYEINAPAAKQAPKSGFVLASYNPAAFEDCVITKHFDFTCECGQPGKPKTKKTGHASEYHGAVTGKYCYTRYESCYVVCAR